MINGFCIYLINGIQHILRARIHGLSAFDQIIDTPSPLKISFTSVSDGYGNKSYFFARLCFFCCFCFFLLFCNLRCIFDQLLLMLFRRILSIFMRGKRTIGQRSLNCQTRIIRVYVYLYDHHHLLHDTMESPMDSRNSLNSCSILLIITVSPAVMINSVQ